MVTEDGGQFVRVCVNKKYLIAEVKNTREDWNHKYKLSNGKTTAIQLLLLMLEDGSIKRKWFNIASISDGQVTFDEFDEFREARRT